MPLPAARRRSRPNLARHSRLLKALAAALAMAGSQQVMACATCGCALNSDAAMGFSGSSGWQVGLQFDYINQDQLRTGTGATSPAAAAAINDAGGSQEVEKQTINRSYTLGLAYTPKRDWTFRLQVPFIERSHSTYGAATNPVSETDVSGASVSSLGDLRLIGNWQGLLPTHSLGLQFGLKLPTGNYGGPNADGTGTVGRNPVAFSSGPNALQSAPGNLLDTSLQAGNGSTDVILGAYWFQAVSQNFDAFASAQWQSSISHKLDQQGADFRPGNQQSLSVGLRDEEDPRLVPQLQINVIHRNPDQGALADVGNSAGTVVYLSPGLSGAVTAGLQAYAFLQLPIYSNLSGYQLFPRWTASIGVSHGF